MKKNSKRNHASRVSDIESNSVDAEKEKKECQNNFVELLPPEVTFKIFSQLDIRSLCRASVTCRSWNHAIRHSDSLWKPHCLTVRAVCQREIDDDLESGYPWRVSFTFAIWSPLDNTVVCLSHTLPSGLKERGFHIQNDIQSGLALGVKVQLYSFPAKRRSPIYPSEFGGHLPHKPQWLHFTPPIQNPQQTVLLTLFCTCEHTHTYINRCVYPCKYLIFSAFQSAF